MPGNEKGTAGQRGGLLAETGLVRAARYLQPGEKTSDSRELHRRGGRRYL